MEWLTIGIVLTIVGLIGRFTNFSIHGIKRYEKRIGEIEAKLQLLEQKTETIEEDVKELKVLVRELTDIKVEIAQIKTLIEVLGKKI